MKKNYKQVLSRAIFILLANLCFNNVMAQIIKVVPGQQYYNEYLNIYLDSPIIYKDSLYIGYVAEDSRGGLEKYLAKANRNEIVPIPYSESVVGGYGDFGFHIVYKNKLYFKYRADAFSQTQMAVYDGSSINSIPNPVGSLDYLGYPIIYNNKLYLEYHVTEDSLELFSFDGSSFSPISNPAGTTLLELYSSEGNFPGQYPIVFNGKLYLKYADGPFKQGDAYTNERLGEYDGTNLRFLQHPVGGTEYWGSPIIYSNKLFFTYGAGSELNLAYYDGINPIKLISNPDKTGSIPSTTDPFLTIFHNKLYVMYASANKTYLGQYTNNDTALTLISNPDAGVGYGGNPAVYNDNLYFGYYPTSGSLVLARYNDTTISIIPSPVTGVNHYDNKLVVYNNYLYTAYTGYPGTFQYDGLNFKAIPSDPPNANYNGSPIVFHDTLFFGVNGFGLNELAYLGDVVLSLQLLNFSAQLLNQNCLLTWQTATEENTGYFTIQRSIDGRTFNSIGKVFAAGNSNTLKNYRYTDANVSALKADKLFYRLQEVDKDGRATYSNIQTAILTSSNSLFSVTPNPAKDFINIVSSIDVNDAEIKITDISGKVLYTAKQNFYSAQQVKLSIAQFASSILIVTIKVNNEHVQFKIVKE